jgi:hypothetical protein
MTRFRSFLIFAFSAFFTISVSAQAKPKIKKAAKNELEKCEEKLKYGSCEKLNEFCNSGDSRSCVSLAIYWQKQGDSENMLSFVKLACEKGDLIACESYGKLYTGNIESQAMDEKMKKLEIQKRKIAEQNAEIERQQNSQRMINGLQQMSDLLNQPTTQQPKQQKCRTVVRPGNGMDGATAYYDTVCD